LQQHRTKIRKNYGGQIAEFGPAIFILLVVIVFPMVDLVYLGAAWASGWYLNQIEAREVASSVPDPANPLGFNSSGSPPGTNVTALLGSSVSQPYSDVQAKYAYWSSCGLSRFCNGNQTQLWIYYAGTPNTYSASPAQICSYSTTTSIIEVRPLVVVPWFDVIVPGGVPGLSKNISFAYSTTQVQEEKGLN
jgi:hypothetical protein